MGSTELFQRTCEVLQNSYSINNNITLNKHVQLSQKKALKISFKNTLSPRIAKDPPTFACCVGAMRWILVRRLRGPNSLTKPTLSGDSNLS